MGFIGRYSDAQLKVSDNGPEYRLQQIAQIKASAVAERKENAAIMTNFYNLNN